jgi:HK97 family phage portal protein
MGLLQRLFGTSRRHEVVEQRRGISTVEGWSLGPLTAGNSVNARIAENLSTALACINVIAGTIATLQPLVYRAQDGGRAEAPTHPVTRLLRQPNERQTWPDFIEWLMASTLLYGNGVAVIEYDGAGRPTGLVPVSWPNIMVQLLPNGALAYDVQQFVYPWGGTGGPKRFLEGEVLHLKDRSDDGYLGRSRLSRAPEVLGAALGLQAFSVAVWRNAAMPSGVLKHPGILSGEAKEHIGRGFAERFSGATNAGRVPVLEEGMSFEKLAMTNEDAEVLASRRFTTEEIARVFGVPPPLVGIWDHSTFTNSATAGAWFGQFCILPWVKKIETEFQRVVFADPSGPFHLELDMSGLMRGDFAARWAAWQIAVNAGVLTPDEIREAEGYPPRSEAAPEAGTPSYGA